MTELLAAEIEPRQFPAGAVITREGEAGDTFHLIVEGSAAVSAQGAPRPSLQRGDCFGEIALLRDIPRTATLTAEQPLRTLALGREEFLTAVTGNSTSMAAADALAAQRLSTDAPDRNDGPARTSPARKPARPNRPRLAVPEASLKLARLAEPGLPWRLNEAGGPPARPGQPLRRGSACERSIRPPQMLMTQRHDHRQRSPAFSYLSVPE